MSSTNLYTAVWHARVSIWKFRVLSSSPPPPPLAFLFDLVFQFPISRNSLTACTAGRFDRPYRRPRCNLSRFSNHRRTNQPTRGGYEKSSPCPTRRTQTPNSIRSFRRRVTSLRQVNDVKLATIIKLQYRPPAANYRGP